MSEMTSVPWKPWAFIRSTATGQSADSTRIATALSDAVMFSPSSLSSFCLMPRSKLANSPPAAAPIAIQPTGPNSIANRTPITPPLTKPLPIVSSLVWWSLILPFSVFRIATASRSLTTLSSDSSLSARSASSAVSGHGYLITMKLYLSLSAMFVLSGSAGWRVLVATSRDRCVVRASLCLAGQPR